MPSRSPAAPRVPDRRRRPGGALVLALTLTLLAGACSGVAAGPSAMGGEAGRAPGTTSAGPTSTDPATVAEADAAGLSRRGEFVAKCPFSHRSPDDPLVHPHHDGGLVASAHSHDFFGNTTTDEHSTPASLLAAGTSTCDLAEDLSSYWAPTLWRNGEPIGAEQFAAYYDVAPGADPAAVEPVPAGLSMIAGNDPRPDPSAAAASWACGRTREGTPALPPCRFGAPLTLRLTFPDCWNGRDLDSADHRGHVAYRAAGACPATHPVPILRLVLSIRYPVYGDLAGITLSSGPLTTAHADFINAWTTAGMREFTDLCIRRQVICGTA